MPSNPELTFAANLSVAALVGLAVGFERERTGHTEGPDARFAGVRTFFMLGLLGGIAGHLLREGNQLAAVVLLAAGGVLSVLAYALTVRKPGATSDGTTETAAILVLGLAALAGMGHRAIAAGVGTLVVAALVGKSRIRGILDRLGERELTGALQFAVLALVILPLLPNQNWGPWGGVNPRELWIIVLIFCAVNYGGFLLQRWVGASRGYAAMGMLGGLVSSTAVTLQFARRSRAEPAIAPSLGLGIVAACTVLVLRVAVVTTVLSPVIARALVPYLAPPFVVGAAVIALVLWRQPKVAEGEPSAALDSPLRIGTALQLALAFQVALFAIRISQDAFGNLGVLTSAFLLGLTDMDALTFSMARLGAEPAMVALAAKAIAVGMLSNTTLKASMAVVLGAPGVRRVAGGGLLALGVASGIGLWIAAR
ncbi:MAG: MgtC/SapB family protein [Gemmatimonadaceae bacterium]|nr:MgtC/SapB family protein [Gemmatimonadaceae bacterium]